MSRREKLESMLQDDPGDAFLMYALAMEHVSEGNIDQGLAGLAAVVEQHPDYVAAYFQQGQLLAGRDETATARDVLTRGIAAADRIGDRHAADEMREFLASL